MGQTSPIGLAEIDAGVLLTGSFESVFGFDDSYGGHSQAWIQLLRGQFFRGNVMSLGNMALRDAEADMDDRSREDLHSDSVRVCRIEPVKIKHLLQVKKEALDLPANPVQVCDILGTEDRRVEDIGERSIVSPVCVRPAGAGVDGV
jgi:hypothetical protein